MTVELRELLQQAAPTGSGPPAPAEIERRYRRRQRRRQRLRRTLTAAAAVAVLAGGLGGVGWLLDRDTQGDRVAVDVDEPHPDADLIELADISDIVVHGRVTEVIERDAQIGDDGAMRYDIHQVEVIETLRGPELGQVEVVLMADVEGTEFAHRPTPSPGDQGLWFLTELDPMFDRDGYVLTTSQGLLVEDGGQLRGARPGSPLHEQIESLGNLERAVDYLGTR